MNYHQTKFSPRKELKEMSSLNYDKKNLCQTTAKSIFNTTWFTKKTKLLSEVIKRHGLRELRESS